MKVTTKTTKGNAGLFEYIEEIKVSKEFNISEGFILSIITEVCEGKVRLSVNFHSEVSSSSYSEKSSINEVSESLNHKSYYTDRKTLKAVDVDNNIVAMLYDTLETLQAEEFTAEQQQAIEDIEFAINSIDFRQTVIDMVNLEASVIQDGEVEIVKVTEVVNINNESESIEHMTQEEYDQYLDSVVKQDAPLERSYDGIVDFESLSFDFLPDFEEIEASILGSYDHPEAAIIDEVEEDELDRVHLINFYDDRHFIELLTDRDGAYILRAEAGDEVTLYKTYSPISASRKAQELTVEYFYYIAERIEHHEEDRSRALDIIQDLKARLLEEGVGLDGAFDKMFKIELGKLLIAC